MLNGPRNAAGHVKLGRHRLPGGTHLQPVIHPTCIHHRPTGSKLSAHRLGQFADHLHIFFFADASACADDNFSTCGEPSKEPSSLKAPACTVSTTRSVFGDTRRLTLALQASSTNLPSTSSTTSEICATPRAEATRGARSHP